MTLPFYLWAAGADSVGLQYPKIDRVRCTDCRRWTRSPAFYPLGRVLCPRHHGERVAAARAWVASLTGNERSNP